MEQGPVNTTADITLDTIVAEVTQRREEFDRLCHVPRDMIEKMIGLGIFRSSVPKRFGVTQHHFVSEATYDSAGALFAGIPPGTPYP